MSNPDNHNNAHPDAVDPVTRPPRQWTRDDVEQTYAAGRPDLVTQALEAGQLADLLAAHNTTEGDHA